MSDKEDADRKAQIALAKELLKGKGSSPKKKKKTKKDKDKGKGKEKGVIVTVNPAAEKQLAAAAELKSLEGTFEAAAELGGTPYAISSSLLEATDDSLLNDSGANVSLGDLEPVGDMGGDAAAETEAFAAASTAKDNKAKTDNKSSTTQGTSLANVLSMMRSSLESDLMKNKKQQQGKESVAAPAKIASDSFATEGSEYSKSEYELTSEIAVVEEKQSSLEGRNIESLPDFERGRVTDLSAQYDKEKRLLDGARKLLQATSAQDRTDNIAVFTAQKEIKDALARMQGIQTSIEAVYDDAPLPEADISNISAASVESATAAAADWQDEVNPALGLLQPDDGSDMRVIELANAVLANPVNSAGVRALVNYCTKLAIDKAQLSKDLAAEKHYHAVQQDRELQMASEELDGLYEQYEELLADREEAEQKLRTQMENWRQQAQGLKSQMGSLKVQEGEGRAEIESLQAQLASFSAAQERAVSGLLTHNLTLSREASTLRDQLNETGSVNASTVSEGGDAEAKEKAKARIADLEISLKSSQVERDMANDALRRALARLDGEEDPTIELEQAIAKLKQELKEEKGNAESLALKLTVEKESQLAAKEGEAATIAKYQQNIDAVTAELAMAKVNVERANAQAEATQAREAELEKELDLVKAEVKTVTDSFATLEVETEQARDLAAVNEADLKELQIQADAKDEKLKDALARCTALEYDLEQTRKQSSEILSNSTAETKQLQTSLMEQLGTSQEKLEVATTETKQVREELEAARRNLKEANATIEANEAALEEAHATIKANTEALEEANATIKAAQKEAVESAEQLKAANAGSEDQVQQLSSALENARKDARVQSEELSAVTKDSKAVTARLNEAEVRVTTLTSSVEELAEANRTLMESVATLENQIASSKTELASMTKRVSTAEEALVTANTAAEEADKANIELQKIISELEESAVTYRKLADERESETVEALGAERDELERNLDLANQGLLEAKEKTEELLAQLTAYKAREQGYLKESEQTQAELKGSIEQMKAKLERAEAARQEVNEQMKAVVAKGDDSTSILQQQLTVATDNLHDLQEKYASAEAQLSEAQSAYAKVTTELEQSNRDHAHETGVLNKQHDEDVAQLAERSSELLSLEEKNKSQTERLSAAEQAIDDLRAQLVEAKGKSDATALQNVESAAALQSKLEERGVMLEERNACVSRLEKELAVARANADDLGTKEKTLQDGLAEATAGLTKLTADYQKVKRQLIEELAAKADMREEATTLQTALDESAARQTESAQAYDLLLVEKGQVDARLEELQESLEKLVEERESEMSSAPAKMAEAVSEAATAQARAKLAEEALAAAHTKAASNAQRDADLRNALVTIDSLRNDLQKANGAKEQAHAEVRELKEELVSQAASFEPKIAKVRAEHDVALAAAEDFKKEMRDLKAASKVTRRGFEVMKASEKRRVAKLEGQLQDLEATMAYMRNNARYFVAKHDYTPSETSPNIKSNGNGAEVELPFVRGQLMRIYGLVDDDGYYEAETRGQIGLVPSNYVVEVPTVSSNILSAVTGSTDGVSQSDNIGVSSEPQVITATRSDSATVAALEAELAALSKRHIASLEEHQSQVTSLLRRLDAAEDTTAAAIAAPSLETNAATSNDDRVAALEARLLEVTQARRNAEAQLSRQNERLKAVEPELEETLTSLQRARNEKAALETQNDYLAENVARLHEHDVPAAADNGNLGGSLSIDDRQLLRLVSDSIDSDNALVQILAQLTGLLSGKPVRAANIPSPPPAREPVLLRAKAARRALESAAGSLIDAVQANTSGPSTMAKQRKLLTELENEVRVLREELSVSEDLVRSALGARDKVRSRLHTHARDAAETDKMLNSSMPHIEAVAASPALNRHLKRCNSTSGVNLPGSIQEIRDDLNDYQAIFEELSGTTSLQATIIQQLLAEKAELSASTRANAAAAASAGRKRTGDSEYVLHLERHLEEEKRTSRRLAVQVAELEGALSRFGAGPERFRQGHLADENEMLLQALREAETALKEAEHTRRREEVAHAERAATYTEQIISQTQDFEKLSSKYESLVEVHRRLKADHDIVHATTGTGASGKAGRNTSSSDRAAAKQFYMRYLRAESRRKNLVYQKKYLLLLLGGFEETEASTLALVAQVEAAPENTAPPTKSLAARRWLQAGAALTAVARMRILARKWRR